MTIIEEIQRRQLIMQPFEEMLEELIQGIVLSESADYADWERPATEEERHAIWTALHDIVFDEKFEKQRNLLMETITKFHKLK